MPLSVIIGAQWGDEGKGRIVDAISTDADIVARFQGGPNAGHTVYIGEEKYIFHLVPMGILSGKALCCIGLGVAVDPLILNGELAELNARGFRVEGRLMVDPRCHLITPEHISRDMQGEQNLGAKKLGTTLKGIGPAFADRTSRIGLRIGSAIDKIENGETLSFPDNYIEACLKLKRYLGDVSLTIHQGLKAGKSVLCEGGQGTMLDLGLGTYPYVTSSNTIAAAAAVNLGLGPKYIDKVIGVIKAYITRVGEGPFPTEIEGEVAAEMRKVGNEYGATTGRPRRCGWFDGPIARYAARVNGVDEWALTKLDVLDNTDPIKAAIAYNIDGELVEEIPPDCGAFSRAKPVYREFPGWKRSTRNCKRLEDLPAEARQYLDFIEEYTEVGFCIVSVGYERNSMIML